MSSNKNESLPENTPELASTNDDNDDHSEFDVSEAKENKVKSSDNSPDVTANISPRHPTTRSESSLNASLTESGRVKRKCVIESEQRKLYMADIDSPPFTPNDNDIPRKLPRVKGRRGRPPKTSASSVVNETFLSTRQYSNIDRPNIYYKSSPYDGYTYTFSTALANVSCRLVLDGHFRNIVEHHKTLNFPHNIFTHDIISNFIPQQKQIFNNNPINRCNVPPAHLFNQPGPHIYRASLTQLSSHITQQPHIYRNFLPNNMPPVAATLQHQTSTTSSNIRPHSNNMPMVQNYSNYPTNNMNNVYQVNSKNNTNMHHPPTPNHIPQQIQQQPMPSTNTIPQYTNLPTQQQIKSPILNNQNVPQHADNMNIPSDNAMWIPQKSFRPIPSPSFIMNNDKHAHSNGPTQNISNHNQFNATNMNNRADNTNQKFNNHRNEHINLLPKMENTESMIHQSSSTTTVPMATTTSFTPEKDL